MGGCGCGCVVGGGGGSGRGLDWVGCELHCVPLSLLGCHIRALHPLLCLQSVQFTYLIVLAGDTLAFLSGCCCSTQHMPLFPVPLDNQFVSSHFGGILRFWDTGFVTSAQCHGSYKLSTPFFRTSVPVGKSPIGVAFGILRKRRRRPRKRRDFRGRSVWDFTYNHEAAGSDVWLKPGFSSSSAQPSRL